MKKLIAKMTLAAVVIGGTSLVTVETAAANPPKTQQCYSTWSDGVAFPYTYHYYYDRQTISRCYYHKSRYNGLTRKTTQMGVVSVGKPARLV